MGMMSWLNGVSRSAMSAVESVYTTYNPFHVSGVGTGLEGALARRRLANWRATERDMNSLLREGGAKLRARSRELCRNNPYAVSACEAFVANAVGAGIKPSSLITDAAKREELMGLWRAWTDESDADGLTDFYGQQALISRALFEAGECFIRFRPRRREDGLIVPLQLQILESEHVPYEMNERLTNGNEVRLGIEYNRIGKRMAYWMYRRHPGDDMSMTEINTPVRVPASEVIHVFKVRRPGEQRGFPHIGAAMVKMYLLDQYDDAELDRKKTAALFAGFVTKQDPGVNMLGEGDEDTVVDEGVAILPMEPGTMQLLQPGEDIKFSEPSDVGANYESFCYRNILAICAAVGIPYMALSWDLKGANYSSMRAGLVEHRRRMEQLQHEVFVFQFCRAVWQYWIRWASLSGAIDLPGFARNPRPWLAVKWIAPKWEWVDPLKDRQAEALAVKEGFKSRSDVIEAEGYDPEEMDRRIAADQQRVERLGIKIGAAAEAPPVEEGPENKPNPKKDAA